MSKDFDDFLIFMLGIFCGAALGAVIGEGCTDTRWRQNMRDGKAPQIIEMLKAEDDYNAKRRALNVEKN